ncbi:MAG: hypothetical protein WAV28_10170 [Sedimentisphaerales bacterium]
MAEDGELEIRRTGNQDTRNPGDIELGDNRFWILDSGCSILDSPAVAEAMVDKRYRILDGCEWFIGSLVHLVNMDNWLIG